MAVYNDSKITDDLPGLCAFTCTFTLKTESNSKENVGVRTIAIFLLLRTCFKESKSNTPFHIIELDLHYLLGCLYIICNYFNPVFKLLLFNMILI